MIKLFKSPLKNLAAITVLLLVIIVSCKKDGINDENQTEAQRIANAKDWYQKTTAKIELKAGKKVENVTQQVSWADAKLYKQADGSEIIGVPVEIGLSNGTKTKGSYLLMISKIGGTYKPVISFNEKKNYFVENIVTSKIKDWYNDATKPNNSHKNTLLNNTGKGKVMVVEGGNMDCTEWYLTETYYDEEGNVIQYYEHYMYTICQGLIDGGGGVDGPSQEEQEELELKNKILAETEPTAMTSPVSSSFLEASADGKERMEAYKWTIAGNPLSGYVVWSHETGTHTRPSTTSNDWKWKSIVHDNFSVAGKPSYMDVTVTQNGQAIPVLGVTTAGISVKCTIEASVIFKGSPFGYPSTDFERNSPVFYIHP